MGMPLTLTVPAVQWQEARKLYQADRCDLSPTTILNYFEHLDRFFSDNPQDLLQVGRLHLLTYLQRFSYWATYNHHLAAFKSFFAWASDFYGFPDPAIRLRSRKEETLPDQRFIVEWEYQKIKASEGYARDIAVYLGNTGLRASEFLAGRPEHITDRVLTVLGKGRRKRQIPLNNTAMEILQKYQFAINLKKSGKYLSKYNLRYRLWHLGDLLALERFGPHSLRHYFATALISRGANIADVSKLLGHANINITIRLYYHPQGLDCVSLLDS